jgi:hypothetical protein
MDIHEINTLFRIEMGVERLNQELIDKDEEIKFVKLHGSVDWFRRRDGTIVRSETEKKRVGRSTVVGDQILYPIQQKDLYLCPWFELFRSSKRDLRVCNTYLFIGYGFNDDFIRNMVVEEYNRYPSQKKFILVNPHAEEIAKTKLSEIKTRLFLIPTPFRQHGTNVEIADAYKS